MKIGHFYLVKHRTFLNCFDNLVVSACCKPFFLL